PWRSTKFAEDYIKSSVTVDALLRNCDSTAMVGTISGSQHAETQKTAFQKATYGQRTARTLC
ncbi:MAG TPA: hypothetical protein VI114_05705, partial [Chthoniobacterales bacterium]